MAETPSPSTSDGRQPRRRCATPWWWPFGMGAEDGVDATDPLLRSAATQLVDVRWAWEYDRAHLRGAVRCPLLPRLFSFERRVRALGLSPAAPTVVVCEHALRSPAGVRRLRAMGFSDVRELRGGMARWRGVEGVPLHAEGS